MADKKLTIWLQAKNMMAAGLSSGLDSMSKFRETFKKIVNTIAMPFAILGVAAEGLGKGLGKLEDIFRGAGRASREVQVDGLKNGFDRLRESVGTFKDGYTKTTDAMNSGARVFDAQTEKVRALEDANRNLEKQKRISMATTKEEVDAIEEEFEAKKNAEEATRKEADILKEVARAREEAAQKQTLASKADELASKMGEKVSQGLAMAANARNSIQKVSGGLLGYLGFSTGMNDKEIASLEDAAKQGDAIAKQALQEQKKLKAEAEKLRLEATEAVKISAEKEAGIEAVKTEALAKEAEKQAKINEERIKKQEENSKKLTDLKEKEADIAKQLSDEQRDDNIDKWNQILADNEAKGKMTVRQFIDEAKQKKTEDEKAKRDEKMAARLQSMEDRGTRLSKRDKEWLDSFRDIRKAGEQAKIAKDNIQKREAMKQLEKLDAIKKALDDNFKEQLKLSQAG